MKKYRIIIVLFLYIVLIISDGRLVCAESTVHYCTTIEEAGNILRSSMKDNVEDITIGYKTNDTNYDLETLYNDILNESLKHTGKPDEGDYLKFRLSYQKGTINLSTGDETYAYTVLIRYQLRYYTTLEQEQYVKESVENIINDLDLEGQSDYKKAESVYNYICNNTDYDYDNINNPAYLLQYTAFAALKDHNAVCQGYASLLYRMLLEVGVDNRIIPGTKVDTNGSKENHVWNLIKLGDVYYNADATWDSGSCGYTYFLKNGQHFNSTHIREDDYSVNSFCSKYPVSDTDYDYNAESDKINIDADLFPDADFRQFVLEKTDTDGDGCLSRAEIISVKNISISNQTVEDLSGISVFDKLNSISLIDNNLKTIDISENRNIITILISGNKDMKVLDVSNNRKLKRLSVPNNGLSEINLENNPKIEYLELDDNNIREINVSNLKSLYIFNCQNNPITSLNVEDNVELQQLICQGCSLPDLNVSNNINLESLWCSDIGIDHIDISNNPKLETLFCGNNNIAAINLDNNPKLKDFRNSGNIVTIGDVKEYDLSKLKDFDPEKAYDWQGAEYDKDNNKLINISSKYVTYMYDCGNDMSLLGTLQCMDDGINIGEDVFPDDVFRQYIGDNFDINNDGFLSIDEINSVSIIGLDGVGVKDLTGIEYFARLYNLNCSNTNIEELCGLSTHMLINLYCYQCTNLKKVELKYQPGLAFVDFRYCKKVKVLDLSECGFDQYGGNNFECYISLCKQLHMIVFPPNVKIKDINRNHYFNSCDTLEKIVFTGDAPDFGMYSFDNLREVTVYYPSNNDTWVDSVKQDYAAYSIDWIEAGKDEVIEAEMNMMRQYDNIIINEENFPDEAFRKYVQEFGDVNGNGILSYYEIDDMREINVLGKGIKDLTGIDFFLHLQKLNCMNNDITEFTCSATHMLNEITFANNTNLKMIEVGRQPDLCWFDFQGCALENVDFSQCGYNDNAGWPVICYFDYCKKLKTIIMPANISTFDGSSNNFRGCESLECVVFTGNAPTFSDNSFSGVGDIVVCYPEDDDTWTEGIMLNYKADSIEWVKGGLEKGLEKIGEREDDQETHKKDVAATIDENSFPDEKFRKYVSETIDSDGDGKLTYEEAESVKEIVLSQIEVADLTGIDYFTELTKLTCSYTKVREIKLTALHKLQVLTSIGNDELINVDVGSQPYMRWYDFGSCSKLTKLDFSLCGNKSDVNAHWSISNCPSVELVILSNGIKRAASNNMHFISDDLLKRLVFVGDAPQFDDSSFDGMGELTIYYPPDNTTWSRDIMKNYSAEKIWWIPATKEEVLGITEEDMTQEAIDKEKAAAVTELIISLPDTKDITLDDEEQISGVRSSYELLTDNQKKLVNTNDITILENAEKRIDDLKKEKQESDKAAAGAVSDEINKIPKLDEITLDNSELIKSVRDKYELLSDEQKALISVAELQLLENAEIRIKELKDAEEKDNSEKNEDQKDNSPTGEDNNDNEASGRSETDNNSVNEKNDSKEDNNADTGTDSDTNNSTSNNTSDSTKNNKNTNDVKLYKYKSNLYSITGNSTVNFVSPSNNKIKQLNIPNTVKIGKKKYKVVSVGNKACYKMTELKKITVGDNVKKIGKQAFSKCTKLKTITFGKGITKLSDRVLEDDKKLSRITFKSTKIKSFGKKTFKNVPRKVDIIIPRKMMKKYVKLIKKAK